MGEYFYIINLDKGEYLHPHMFGFGLKFGEVHGIAGPMHGLTYLICDGEPPPREPLFGSWVGDRIIFAGDYSPARFDLITDPENPNICMAYPALVGSFKNDNGTDMNMHIVAENYFTDISEDVRKMMKRSNDWLEDQMENIEKKKPWFFEEE